MALIYPGGIYKPLGDQTEPKMSDHDIICLHTMVGYLKGTDSMFRDSGYSGTESHFGVGGSWDGSDLDGEVWQWQDLNYQADANLDGNYHVLSIETSDGGNSNNHWTEAQLDSIVDLCCWLCERFNIPPTLIPDTKVGRRGIGYHRQGCDPYRISGGEKWSDAYGKTCPGDNRIGQLINIIIPQVSSELGGTDAPPENTAEEAFYDLAYESGDKMTLRYLGDGDSGFDVKSLQHLLNLHSIKTDVDGAFGPKTESSVMSFQGSKNLTKDGVVGPMTMERLLED